jgi:transmembrane sensor
MNSNRPPTPAESPDDLERVAREAGEWRARQDAGIALADEREFARWLEADERHVAVFSEMDATWRLLDRANEISPATLGVTRGTPSSAASRTKVSPRTLFLLALPLAAAAMVAFLFLLKPAPSDAPTPAQTFTQVANADGTALKRVDLPDGSIVRLKADSAIVVNYTTDERRVRLVRGEAHFTVAKVATPFVVAARGVDVRAVGTAFNVRRNEDAIEVLVTEGKVGLEKTETRESLLPARAELRGASAMLIPVLAAGERATVAMDFEHELPAEKATIASVTEAEIQQTLAWQDQRIAFEDASLAEIVAQFNRFNQHQLVIADATLARLRIGGSFRADDPDTFVHLIETRDGLVAERRGTETVLRRVK